MKPTLLVIAVFLALLTNNVARAEMTGKDLHTICAGNDSACMMYITGVQEGYRSSVWNMAMAMKNDRAASTKYIHAPYCVPKTASNTEAKTIVWMYLSTNPQELHQPASQLVIKTLAKAWPCK